MVNMVNVAQTLHNMKMNDYFALLFVCFIAWADAQWVQKNLVKQE